MEATHNGWKPFPLALEYESFKFAKGGGGGCEFSL